MRTGGVLLDAEAMKDVALGATILGTGGGGDPYIGRLLAESALRTYGPVELVAATAVPDDALVAAVGMMGAPTVMIEKLPSGEEFVGAVAALEQALERPVQAVTCVEAGGINSTLPILVAARLRLPLVDADGMGRAFPELQMVTPTLIGVRATPLGLADEKGNVLVIRTPDNRWTESIARAVCVIMGCTAFTVGYAMTGAQLREGMIPGTLSRLLQIGRALRAARRDKADPIRAVTAVTNGVCLFHGKVADVERRTERGFARGRALFAGHGPDAGRSLLIEFQNENLIAAVDDRIVTTVPDLITVLEEETAEPITTESLRYGQRVVAVAIPCDRRWRSEAGLSLVGPRYFGYDVDYRPVEELSSASNGGGHQQ